MLTFSQMLIQLLVAMGLGAIVGLEREIVGKEAGVRTCMLVSGGAAIFTMIGIMLPFLATPSGNMQEILARGNGAMGVVANIVIGIGFLGAGIIFKSGERVHGLTTAALVWMAAAIGMLVGLGLIQFAVVSALLVTVTLYVLRHLSIHETISFEEEKK